MQSAQTWELMTCQRLKLAIGIGTAQTARLFSMFISAFSAMVAICGCTMKSHS